jgi:hypothetical protein
VAAVHVQGHGHVDLGPSFPFSQQPNAFPNLNQEGMISAGHPFMVAILFIVCVWHARQCHLKGRASNFKITAMGLKPPDQRNLVIFRSKLSSRPVGRCQGLER